MPDEDHQVARRAWAAFRQADDEGLLRELHPEIDFQVFPQRFERVGARLLVTGRWDARGIESGVELQAPAT